MVELARLVGGPADGMVVALDGPPRVVAWENGAQRVIEYARMPTVGGPDDGAYETWVCVDPSYGVLAVESAASPASWLWLSTLISRAYHECLDVELVMSLRTALSIIGDLVDRGEPDETAAWMWSRDLAIARGMSLARSAAPLAGINPGHVASALRSVVGVYVTVDDGPDGVVIAKVARRG